LFDPFEAVLEEQRGQRGFEQCGQDVAIAGKALELVRGNVDATPRELASELELASNDGTALTRNDVRADLREAPLGEVGVALVELARHRELENAVTEELQPLVGGGPVDGPGRVRIDLLRPRVGQIFDQLPKRGDVPRGRATGARRRSRRPG